MSPMISNTFSPGDRVRILRWDAGVEPGTIGTIMNQRSPNRVWSEPVWDVRWDVYESIETFGVYENNIEPENEGDWFNIWGAP